VTDLWTTATAGVVAGFVAGVLVLGAQRMGQWIINRLEWPFKVVIKGRQNPTLATYQLRIRVFDRASLGARVNMVPHDSAGQIINGWNVVNPWGYTQVGLAAAVPPRAWVEFWMEGPNAADGRPPAEVALEAWFFTDEKGRSHSYAIVYSA